MPSSSESSSRMDGVEFQVISRLTADLDAQTEGVDRRYRPPLPLEKESACLFPRWMVAIIVVLSLVGIIGAIFEMRFQLRRI